MTVPAPAADRELDGDPEQDLEPVADPPDWTSIKVDLAQALSCSLPNAEALLEKYGRGCAQTLVIRLQTGRYDWTPTGGAGS